jgi:hypothetical protein
VYVNGRTQKRVDAAMAAIRKHPATVKVDGIVADFSSSAAAAVLIAKLPLVDEPVNNVGIFEAVCRDIGCGLVPRCSISTDASASVLAAPTGPKMADKSQCCLCAS